MSIGMNNTFASRDVADLTFCDYATGRPVLFVDYANQDSVNLSGETIYAYGSHGHLKKVGFAGDRGGQITFETQITSMKLLSLVTGGELSETAEYMRRKVLTAAAGVLTLPDGVTVADENAVSVFAADDDCGTPLEVTVSEGKITLPESADKTADYVVYYLNKVESGVTRINITGNKMPKEYRIYGYTTIRDEMGVDHAMRQVIYKAMPSPEVQLAYSNTGDPQSMSITFELEADKENNLIDFVYCDDDELEA